MKILRCLAPAITAAALLLPSAAAAHVRLVYPAPRYPAPAGFDNGEQLKEGPCGVTNDSRTTDPGRITTFTPGETITVQFRESVGHPGHYRIAFDDDGQDDLQDPSGYDDIQTSPVLPILLDGIADNPGTGMYEVEITLPNTPCNNCTLQLIQVMTDKEPYELGDDDVYHQCADIVLTGEAGGSGGNDGSGGVSSGSGGMNSSGAGGAAGSPTTAGAAGTTGGSVASGMGGTASAGSGTVGSGGSVRRLNPPEAGCALRQCESDGRQPWTWLGLLVLGLSLRLARSPRSGALRRESRPGGPGL